MVDFEKGSYLQSLTKVLDPVDKIEFLPPPPPVSMLNELQRGFFHAGPGKE